jgi:GT2 family glycosyltransferase
MKLVILVLNWGQPQATLACLASLRRAELCGGEIVVIDNGSGDGSADILRAADPALRLITLPENLGYAGGNNVGLRLALEEGADRILVLNNDTTVAPEFLQALMGALDDSPEAAAVCAAVHRLDRPEMLNVAFARINFLDRNAVRLRGVNALPSEGFAHRQEVEAVIGCCVLFRAEALRAVGLFDEDFFAYHEDIDWSLRARRAGWTLLYEPYARVFHARSGSTTLDQLPDGAGGFEPGLPNAEPVPFNPRRAYLGARNLMRLVKKHADEETQKEFARICLRGLPLEYSAVLFNREGTLQLEKWDYEVLWRFLREERPPLLRIWWRAERSGRTAQVRAYARGLWDGWRNRPLPLRRLGLR